MKTWLIKFTKTLVWKEKGLRFAGLRDIDTGAEIYNLVDIPREISDFFGIDEFGNAEMLKEQDLERTGIIPNQWKRIKI